MKIKQANEEDLSQISGWFSTEAEATRWGGPSIPFPLDLEKLKVAISWNDTDSYAFINQTGHLIGFAQVFHRFGYKHLGRIVISPNMRGKGIGYKLMNTLIESTANDGLDYSLFVYGNNSPAKKLYENLGFLAHDYPDKIDHIEGCLFMVKHNKFF